MNTREFCEQLYFTHGSVFTVDLVRGEVTLEGTVTDEGKVSKRRLVGIGLRSFRMSGRPINAADGSTVQVSEIAIARSGAEGERGWFVSISDFDVRELEFEVSGLELNEDAVTDGPDLYQDGLEGAQPWKRSNRGLTRA